jgi:hypothetical protein
LQDKTVRIQNSQIRCFFVKFLKLPLVKFANLSCESRQKSFSLVKVTLGLSFYESKNSIGFAGLNNFSFKIENG